MALKFREWEIWPHSMAEYNLQDYDTVDGADDKVLDHAADEMGAS